MPHLIETLFQLPESNFPTPLKLYSAGITHPDPNYRIHREKPNLTVIEYIVSGEGHLVIDGRRYHITAGDVYLLHPFTDQDYWSDRANPWEKIWFNLRGSLVKDLMRRYGLENVYYFHESGLHDLFADCLIHMRKNLENAHEAATLTAHRLIYHISRQLHSGETMRNPAALEMKRWMDQRICSPVNLAEMGRQFGFSVSQTIRIFQREYGETPYCYFLKKKLELAMLMLRNTRKTVKEIAFELNFSDPYYFSNLFKRKFGKSPRRIREDL